MTVPVYPSLRPLVLEDKDLIDGLFRRFPPEISEFTFSNIFAWRCAYNFCISTLDDSLLIISLKDKKNPAFFEPIGEQSSRVKAIEGVFSLSSGKAKFVRIPEATVRLLAGKKNIRIYEDRNNFDYVYLRSDLIQLKGKDFDAKRNFIRRFNENYTFEYKQIDRTNIEKCLSFEKEWCSAKECQRVEGLSAERTAVQEMLKFMEKLRIKGGLIEVNGKVEAVSLGEELNPETFVIHIEKANGSYTGIYQAINQMFAQDAARKYKFINREQDLGVTGLRRAKESYHPHHMVKKYTLTLE